MDIYTIILKAFRNDANRIFCISLLKGMRRKSSKGYAVKRQTPKDETPFNQKGSNRKKLVLKK